MSVRRPLILLVALSVIVSLARPAEAFQPNPIPTPDSMTGSSPSSSGGDSEGSPATPDRGSDDTSPETPALHGYAREGSGGEVTVSLTATQTDTNLVAVVDANVGADDSGPTPVVAASPPASEPDDTAAAAAPTPGGADCARFSPGYYDAETDTSHSGACVRWRVCGAERVDDVASGRISGVDSVGRYRDYIDQIGGYILSDTGVVPGADLTTINSVSDFTLSQGLGDTPGIRSAYRLALRPQPF